MARYERAFRDRVVARLLPPESAPAEVVAREIGIGVKTLERWREMAECKRIKVEIAALQERPSPDGVASPEPVPNYNP